MTNRILPVGKFPSEFLARLLAKAPVTDPRVVVRPGIGMDCAVVEAGDELWVFKSDPITFATDEIGWYLVQVNANDIATTGALPRWLLVTLLLPEGRTTAESAEGIMDGIYSACREMGISVIGGHTEITFGLERPIAVGTLVGGVPRDKLVTPRGCSTGDRVLLTKGVPIEATAILAREFPARLESKLTGEEIERAKRFLHEPGISILRDAQIALRAGRVTAMHDPTEGGLATALWELAEASGRAILFDPAAVPIPALSARVCAVFDLDPLAAIASGALLLTAPEGDAEAIRRELENQRIVCEVIGEVREGLVEVRVKESGELLRRPERDEIARVFEG